MQRLDLPEPCVPQTNRYRRRRGRTARGSPPANPPPRPLRSAQGSRTPPPGRGQSRWPRPRGRRRRPRRLGGRDRGCPDRHCIGGEPAVFPSGRRGARPPRGRARRRRSGRTRAGLPRARCGCGCGVPASTQEIEIRRRQHALSHAHPSPSSAISNAEQKSSSALARRLQVDLRPCLLRVGRPPRGMVDRQAPEPQVDQRMQLPAHRRHVADDAERLDHRKALLLQPVARAVLTPSSV